MLHNLRPRCARLRVRLRKLWRKIPPAWQRAKPRLEALWPVAWVVLREGVAHLVRLWLDQF